MMKDRAGSFSRVKVGWFPGEDGLCLVVFNILCEVINV